MSLATVRLTAHEKRGIREAVEEVSARLGLSWKRISLFGSRANPLAKGGDIDLYIEIESPPGVDTAAFSSALRIELEDRIGERKVDLVIDDGRRDLGAFGEIVKRTKVDLWTTS